MKIRTGFVSNSSSSSFCIYCKEELTREMLTKIFEVPKEHPLHDICEKIVNIILEKSKPVNINELREGAEIGCDVSIRRLKEIESGKNVYEGEFNSEFDFENGFLEAMLRYSLFDFKSNDFVFLTGTD
jgi:hypothetical protein